MRGAAREPQEPPAGTVTLDLSAGAITLRGEIDAALEPTLLDTLRAVEATPPGDPADLRVDAREVSFIDSTGIKFLALLTQRSGRPVLLVQPSSHVRFVLDVTRISELVTVVD